MPRVIHFEIPVKDPQRAIDFYTKALGWKIQKWNGPIDYWLISTGSSDEPGIDGALSPQTEGKTINNLAVSVESADDAAVVWQQSGGEIVQTKGAVPGVGWMVSGKDTEGNTITLMEDDPEAK